MSDAVSILLLCLVLLAPVVLVIGLAVALSRKSGTKGRNEGSTSVSDTMSDIGNVID